MFRNEIPRLIIDFMDKQSARSIINFLLFSPPSRALFQSKQIKFQHVNFLLKIEFNIILKTNNNYYYNYYFLIYFTITSTRSIHYMYKNSDRHKIENKQVNQVSRVIFIEMLQFTNYKKVRFTKVLEVKISAEKHSAKKK